MRVSKTGTRFILFFLLTLHHFSCKRPHEQNELDLEKLPLDFAEGFEVYQGNGYKIIKVIKAFPGTHSPFRYLVKENTDLNLEEIEFDAIVQIPVSRVVMTSTTQIPHLEYLDSEAALIGFPNLELISSQSVRKRIGDGKVTDLGSGPQANFEMIIDLDPDWIMISTLGDDLQNLELFQQSGFPALINGEYMEQHPLGRAEWIKFTGALLGKWDKACAVFDKIRSDYEQATGLIESQQLSKPSILSGVMYKDIWYVPGADSWGAHLINAAGGNYIFEEQKGTGSAQLSYEYVLEKAQDADFWIGAADFNNLEEMKNTDSRYSHFKAFQLNQVYTYTHKKGETGGVEYFELGYLRPDLILKDLIKIMYPDLLPGYKPYFYTKLDEK
ncbi:ABC transporter substrate-binding protein [Shivajiella indica]|uniref:ABC transporter substrate-binding protein n=1 Tax=Shivajiella indica TaxID=872115 RepID=A0ABW5BGC5_9BACT